MSETKNIIIASVVSMGILLLFQHFFSSKQYENIPVERTIEQTNIIKNSHSIQKGKMSYATLDNENLNATIEIDETHGDIYISKVNLKNFHESLNDDQSLEIMKMDNKNYLLISFGVNIPKLNKTEQNKKQQIKLSIDKINKNQVVIRQFTADIEKIVTITIDDKYMFKIETKFVNKNRESKNFQLHYELYNSHIEKDENTGISTHTGIIGFNGEMIEKPFDEKMQITLKGWCGFTDKYTLTALSPNTPLKMSTNFLLNSSHSSNDTIDANSSNMTFSFEETIQPECSATYTVYMFAGPKSVDILDKYKHTHKFEKFDLAIDFGMFYFITRPVLHLLKFLYDTCNNMGLAIIILTFLFKVLFFPLSKKSSMAMAKIKQLQPKIENIRSIYKDDKKRINTEIAELYKKEKVNPASGCMPMILQIPIFFSLYKVLSISIEMRHANFFGWIHDLSAPDPTSLFNLFGLLKIDLPNMLKIGIWPILMGLTMVWQQKVTPMNGDETQQKMANFLPIVFTFMLAQFPVGVVIYWCFSNIFTITQQIIFNRILKKYR